MGLFSSKKVVSVATSVNRVIEDQFLPNTMRSGVIKGLLRDNGEQMIEYLMEDMVSNVGILCNRMYRYGRDTYLYGLPQSTSLTSQHGGLELKEVIGNLVGSNVDFEYYHFGQINNQHVGWQYLMDEYQYDPATNELKALSASKISKVYLEDLQVVVRDITEEEVTRGSLEQWGLSAKSGVTPARTAAPVSKADPSVSSMPHTPIVVEPSAAEDYFIVTYVWKNAMTSTLHRGQLTFPMPTYDLEKNYFQAKYWYMVDGVKKYGFFTYLEESGTYPMLDTLFSPEYVADGQFFPFAYFRMNKKSTNSDKTTVAYEQTKKLLKYIKMPFDDVADAINENPDIKDVDSAFLMMGVPANTTNEIEERYLFDFFRRWYFQFNPDAKEVLPTWSKPPKVALVIQDKYFKMSVSATNIRRFMRVGSQGKIGGCSSGTGLEPFSYQTTVFDPDAGGLVTKTVTKDTKYHYYIKQLSEQVYEEIRVYGLQTSYYVQGKYASSQKKDNEDNLLIPIDRSLTSPYGSVDREELYARSLHYVFNSLKITKIAWYQQGWFSTFLIIVAIAWTIVSFGSDGGGALGAALAAAGATGMTLLVLYVVVNLAIMYITSMVFQLFVKLVGADVAIIVAIIMVAYGFYDAYEFGSIKGAPWAEMLLQTGSGLMKVGFNEYMTDQMLDLAKDYAAFSEETKAKMELLENAEKLLQGNNLLAPLVVFGETPQEYFGRTVHTGNIGVISLDAIHSYVDISLTLPDISKTISFS